MTFYNLPDTDVQVEYDKDSKELRIWPFTTKPKIDVEPVDLPYPGEPMGICISWSDQ